VQSVSVLLHRTLSGILHFTFDISGIFNLLRCQQKSRLCVVFSEKNRNAENAANSFGRSHGTAGQEPLTVSEPELAGSDSLPSSQNPIVAFSLFLWNFRTQALGWPSVRHIP